VAQTLDLRDLVENDYVEALRRTVASTYGVISGQPAASVLFDDKASTAYHDPFTESTTVTSQNIPAALRNDRLLKLVLLQGAAAHEAGHHKTLRLSGEKHEYGTFQDYFAEPFVWPNRGTIQLQYLGEWHPVVANARHNAFLLTEDIRANAFIEREYTRVFWPSLKTLIRYTRMTWSEAMLASMRTGVELAKGGFNIKGLSSMVSTPIVTPPTGEAETVAARVMGLLGISVNPAAVRSIAMRANIWWLLPELFRLMFIYPAREVDVHRDPIVNLRPDIEAYWEHVVDKFPPRVRCFFADDADSYYRAVTAIRAACDVAIKSSATPEKADDAYRIHVGRYFSDVMNLECWTPQADEWIFGKQEMGTPSHKSQGGSDDKPGAPSPEGKMDPGKSGGSATRRAGNKQESKMRERGKQEGDASAEEEARERGDPGSGGMDPVRRIREWSKKHPYVGGKEVESMLDEYLKSRKEARS
jgi:hypothetical protein